MRYLAKAVDAATFRGLDLEVTGGAPPGMPTRLPAFDEGLECFRQAKKLVVFGETLSAGMIFAKSGTGIVFAPRGHLLSRCLAAPGAGPAWVPTWVEFELPGECLAEVLPLQLASGQVGCLFVPQDGAGVQAIVVVSPLAGQALALPAALKFDSAGGIQSDDANSHPFSGAVLTGAFTLALLASAMLSAVACGFFDIVPAPSCGRENTRRAKQGLPPQIACGEIVLAGTAIADTATADTGIAEDAGLNGHPRIGWVAIDNRQTGVSEVFALHHVPEALREMQDRTIAEALAHARQVEPDKDETGLLAAAVLVSAGDGGWRNGAAVALAGHLQAALIAITLSGNSMTVEGLDTDGDPASQSSRDLLEAWMERRNAYQEDDSGTPPTVH